MNDTITRLLRHTLAAYPSHTARLSDAQIRDMQEVWLEMLGDLPADLLAAAVRSHIERSQWLPSVAEIRQAAVKLMRQGSPAQESAIDAWGSVKREVRRVGSYGAPYFVNPITARVVQRMGWREICLSEDPEAVVRAQFERYYNAEMTRAEEQAGMSADLRDFLATLSGQFLAPPRVSRPLLEDDDDPIDAP